MTTSAPSAECVARWQLRWSSARHAFDVSSVRAWPVSDLDAQLLGAPLGRFITGAPDDVQVALWTDPFDGSFLAELNADGGQFIAVEIFNHRGQTLARGKVVEEQLEWEPLEG